MDSPQWKRVRELFEAALDLPESERQAFLDDSSAPRDVVAAAQGLLRASLENVSAFDPPTPTPDFQPASPAFEVSRGTTIGNYTVEGRIGVGGMADVFVATQDRPSRRVALKILRGGLSERAIKRFQFEAEILGQLTHPSIAQVYDADETEVDGRRVPYIAMEFVEGAEDVISYARRKQLNREERLKLFLQIADAIQYGHEHGVLHRDIKPSNLLVSEDGRPKVIDYGIARAENQAGYDRTMTGEVFGTIGYLAPERLRGDHSADTRSEVYSLGVVLFELITGRPPVDLKGRSFVEAVDRIERHEPPRASSVVPGIPEGIDWIGLKALAIDRTRRYPSVADLMEDIRRYLGGEAVLAGAPSASYRVRSWLRRNRVLTALVLLGLIGTVATIVGTRIGLNRAEEEAKIAQTASLRAGQEAARAETEARAAKRQARLSDAALTILENTLKSANSTQGGVDARISVVLDAIDKEVLARFADEPEIANRMDSLLVTAYLGSRNLTAAKRVLSRAEKRPQSADAGNYDIELARAFIFQLEGKIEEAETALRKLIEINANATEPEALTRRLEASRGLIGILLTQGRYPDAAAFAEEVYATVTEELGEDARASFMRLRGDALRMVGKLDEALQSVEASIAISRGASQGTYELITGLRSAGAIELRRSRSKEARTFLEEAVKLANEFLGTDHPETALTSVILSDVYVRDGEYEKALEAFDQIAAMPAFQKMTMRNQVIQKDTRAFVLASMGRTEEALEASMDAVAKLDDSFVPGDPVRLSVLGMNARLLIQEGQSEKGMAQLQGLIEAANEAHGVHSPMSISMEQDLMQSLLDSEKFEEALKLAEEQIAFMVGKLPDDQSQFWNARQVKIEALMRLKRSEDAEAAIAEIRELVDLEKSPSRKKRINAYAAIVAAQKPGSNHDATEETSETPSEGQEDE